MFGRGQEPGAERLNTTRDALGFVSDVGGAIAAASMFAAIAAGIVGAVVGLTADRPAVVLAGGAFAAGVAVGAGCMYAIGARRSSSVESQLGYRWLQATYTYVIDEHDPHVHRQTTDVTIKAIRDGVRTFSNQYRWSGSGDERPPTVTSHGHFLTGPVERSLAWRRYDVRLDPFLQRGETTTVSLVQELHDTDERFELFLAKTVHEPMERLVLSVILPIRLMPHRVWCITQVGAGPQARVVDRRPAQPVGTDRRAVLEWRVNRPVLGRSYQLRWDYVADRGIYEQSDQPLTEGEPQAR